MSAKKSGVGDWITATESAPHKTRVEEVHPELLDDIREFYRARESGRTHIPYSHFLRDYLKPRGFSLSRDSFYKHLRALRDGEPRQGQ